MQLGDERSDGPILLSFNDSKYSIPEGVERRRYLGWQRRLHERQCVPEPGVLGRSAQLGPHHVCQGADSDSNVSARSEPAVDCIDSSFPDLDLPVGRRNVIADDSQRVVRMAVLEAIVTDG